MNNGKYDVVVVGAGVGGVSAALASARLGAKTALVERGQSIGGTGVHSPVGLISTFFDKSGRFINDGIYRDLFPHVFETDYREIQTYDPVELGERYDRLTAEEPLLTVRTGFNAREVRMEGGRILGVDSGEERVEGRVWVDGTANGHLSVLAGADYEFGDGNGGSRFSQPATLTFHASEIDFSQFETPLPHGQITTWAEYKALNAELSELYQAYKKKGLTSNPRDTVICIPWVQGKGMVFIANHVTNVDPFDPESMREAYREGRKQVDELITLFQTLPAFAESEYTVSKMLGVREGRRVMGDYVLTEEDCLGEARFPDMVAAGGFAIDIHGVEGNDGKLIGIPGSGYYHIPLRCLQVKGLTNLLTGSRCVSASHEAHGSLRVMPSVSAIGQGAGTTAALAALHAGRGVRNVPIADIQQALRDAGQFVETVET